MPISIRQLNKREPEALRQLLEVFADAFEDDAHYRSNQPSDAYLAKLLANDDFIALAAFDGGAAVGGLCAYVLHKFEQERPEVYIYDLAVAEAFRRKGIATALISELRGVARTIGASVIYVQADEGDEPAIALYRSLGTEERVLHFDIIP